MESIRFNTCNIYKGCNVLFFNELTGQSAGNFTKKLYKHLTSTKKTINKMKTKVEILQIIESKKEDKLFKQKCRDSYVCYVCGNDLEHKLQKESVFYTKHYLVCKENTEHYLELITPERKK